MKPLLSLTLLAVAVPAADSLRFDAAPDTTVVKRLSSSIEVDLLSGVMRMGDREEPAPDDFELVLMHETSVVLSDRYARVADGAPVRLERTYDSIEVTFGADVVEEDGDEDRVDESFDSDLADEGVAWTWDAESEAWEASSLDEDAPLPDDLLEGLHFDYDGLALLPDGDVSEGDSWELDAGTIASILGLGGDLGLTPQGGDNLADEMVPVVICSSPAFALDELDGELQASYVESIEEGGRFARVELTGSVTTAGDVGELLETVTDVLGGERGMEELEIATTVELEGEFVWNLDEGRLESFELAGPIDVALIAAGDQGGTPVEVELEFEGRASWTLVTE